MVLAVVLIKPQRMARACTRAEERYRLD